MSYLMLSKSKNKTLNTCYQVRVTSTVLMNNELHVAVMQHKKSFINEGRLN